MTLGEIEAGLFERLGYQQNPDSAVIRKVRRLVNQTHRRILAMKGMTKLRQKVLSFSTVANSPFVVLPQAAVFVNILVDRTNQYPLEEISMQELRFRDPALASTASNPNAYVILNYAAHVARDPSAAASLFAVSDNAGDGPGLSVTLEGVVTGGIVRRATTAMNGVGGINLSGLITTWENPTKFLLSAEAKGDVTLREGSASGTELARIPAGQSSTRYTQLHLHPTPGTALTLYADVELRLTPLTSPNDEPLIPEDHQDLLECGSLLTVYTGREKTALWKLEYERWRDGLADLKSYLARKGGVALGPKRQAGGRRFSQLGPWFRPGS